MKGGKKFEKNSWTHGGSWWWCRSSSYNGTCDAWLVLFPRFSSSLLFLSFSICLMSVFFQSFFPSTLLLLFFVLTNISFCTLLLMSHSSESSDMNQSFDLLFGNKCCKKERKEKEQLMLQVLNTIIRDWKKWKSSSHRVGEKERCEEKKPLIVVLFWKVHETKGGLNM